MNTTIYLIINFTFVTTGMYFLIFWAPFIKTPVHQHLPITPPERSEEEEKLTWWQYMIIYAIAVPVVYLAETNKIAGFIVLSVIVALMIVKWIMGAL